VLRPLPSSLYFTLATAAAAAAASGSLDSLSYTTDTVYGVFMQKTVNDMAYKYHKLQLLRRSLLQQSQRPSQSVFTLLYVMLRIMI